jgi:hypothetical protein
MVGRVEQVEQDIYSGPLIADGCVRGEEVRVNIINP